MAKIQAGPKYQWRTINKKCQVCERTFPAVYFDDPEFTEDTAKGKAKADAKTLCGPACVRASKVILAGLPTSGIH